MTRPARTKRIPLLRKNDTIVAYAFVDARLYGYLNRWTWRYDKRPNGRGGYAVRGERRGDRIRLFYMSRVILGLDLDDPRQAEHINCNRLDNRRRNLRIAPRAHADNNQNRPLLQRNNRSGYRGVYWHKRFRQWVAQSSIDGRQCHLGYFDTAHEAHLVVSAWRAEHMPFSEDARS
jgi:hypothetical protein